MRILFLCNGWHIARTPCRTIGTHPELTDGRHQWVRAVGAAEVMPYDVPFDAHRDTLDDIVRRLPGGKPDVMVVWEPGYQALPAGIEEASFPVVACYSDWNLVMPSQAGMLDVYDTLFTDRPGVRTLAEMGYANAEYWPMWGHDPGFSRVIPGVKKLLDIGMIGNLSATVQRERAPWLARVAELAGRYRVRIAGGVYGEAYTRMLNATRITFNRSIRGEMNMRCYEAAACGSLLFYEEENEEIRDTFTDRVHCVLYNERNLEELLDYYLTHDDEREQIVAAAAERVAQVSFPRNLNRLADRLEALDLPGRMKRRTVCALPVPERRKRHARQAAGTRTLGANQAALRFLQEALAADPNDASAHNDLAVVSALLASETTCHDLQRQLTAASLEHTRRAVELQPYSALFTLNMAAMHADTGRPEMALDLTQQALALLESGRDDPSDPLCLSFPFSWNEFRVQYSVLYNATRPAPDHFAILRRCLLFHRAGMLLGRLAEERSLQDLAVLGYRIAASARPDLGSGRVALGRALARRHVEAGMRTDPFLMHAWTTYAELLLRLDCAAEARQFATNCLRLMAALAPPAEQSAISEALSELEETRQALLQLLDAWEEERSAPVSSIVLPHP